MSIEVTVARPPATQLLPPKELYAFSSKATRRHRGPEFPIETPVSPQNKFEQQLNLRTRLAKSLMKLVLRDNDMALKAHENPTLAHHAAPHAKRVEFTLQGLILNTINPLEQELLERHAEILGAAMVFPRGHDFWHQVLTGQQQEDAEERGDHGKFNAKHGHDLAASLVMAAQTMEYAEGLRKVYKENKIPIKEDQIQHEAQTTMLLAQVISSFHGMPTQYEKIIGQRDKKAYTIKIDPESQVEKKLPLPYKTEKDAKTLLEAFRTGELDPFSMNQAQMIAITTYEITHSKKGAFDPEFMRTYEYGKEPYGLHPEMFTRYGDTLTILAADETPIEDLLPAEITKQRDLIEYLGKLSLLADTIDQVADPTGRVVRSLFTQVTFTDKNPRPIWPHGLTENDLDNMLDEAINGTGDDTRGDGANSKTYSLTKRLDYEIKNWYPFSEMLDPAIKEFAGEITVMAQLEQFKTIEAWMDNNPTIWSEPLQTFYNERVAKYEKKHAKRDPQTVFDSTWLHKEKDRVPELLQGLPHATQFTEEDKRMLRLYRDMSLAHTQEKYDISPDKMAELINLSKKRRHYKSPFIPTMYDVVFSTADQLPPIRGVDFANE